MKKILCFLLLSFYIFIGVYAAQNEAICDRYVRLHILANSNSPYDQAVKIKVRNNLLETYYKEFSNFKTKEEAIQFIKNNERKITNHINRFLRENNIEYSSKITIEKTQYKKSIFNNINLPEGIYSTVKISLGNGKGKNLFFILFPALSIKENVTVKINDTNKTEYKSKIWELIS